MTPKLSHAIEMTCRTDPGLIRERNEDAVSIDPDCGFAILADGMGGYNAGDVASNMTVNLISQGLRQALIHYEPHRNDPVNGRPNALSMLENQIQLANAAVFEAAQTQSQCAGMGTTLVAALFYDNRLMVGHIGDSRLYRLRAGLFEQLTRDHSLLQEQIDAGMISREEARFVEYKNLVTRALGIDAYVEPEFNEFYVEVDDVYLLCSDGLNDMLADHDIQHYLQDDPGQLQQLADHLIQAANEVGGRDNVSVILIRIRADFPTHTRWMPKLLSWLGHARGC
ncbi:protein phosphatase [Chitinivorax tropicus]|uniref:Protein phosphatase n=1 Tax=Chitinivorax tropicus TaxID=714531 RepID=A0A840MTY0_9PROT|nr:Stp1/IreP family PP2C-type Ser/Thr phosphatase [Chitinivorax tropicus]MBB5020252.1 protein phosphatase [Chitinivorax tropicus]